VLETQTLSSWTRGQPRSLLYLAPSIAACRAVALSYSVLPWHIESTWLVVPFAAASVSATSGSGIVTPIDAVR
jgi:hypothetical protein